MSADAKDTLMQKPKDNEKWKDKYRFLVLITCCCVEFGVYPAPFSPIPLEKELTHDLGISATQYGLLFSLGSLIGIVFSGLAGYMLSKYGRGVVTIGATAMIVLGELFNAIAASISSYGLLLFGQVIATCGVNCWAATSSTYMSIWFKNKETAFALSMDMCCCFLSVAIMNFAHPRVYNKFHALRGNYWMLFMMAVFGFCCGLILCYLDTFAPKHTTQEEEKKEEHVQEGEKKQGGGLLAVIKGYPAILWFLIGSMVTVIQSFMLQDVVASKMFQDLYGLDNEAAGFVIALPNLVLGVLTFVCGIIVYRVGRKPLILLCAAILSLISIFVLNILPTVEKGERSFACAGPYVFVGVAHSFYSAAFWSCIPYIVEEKLVGLTLGVMFMLQSTASALCTLIQGVIRDSTQQFRKGYLFSGVFIMILTAVGICFLVIVYRLNAAGGGKLDIPEMVLAQERLKKLAEDEKSTEGLALAAPKDTEKQAQ